jgi:alkaline phosphatase D
MFKYDLSFVGLDCRSFSTEPGNLNSTILGTQQLNWLRQTLFSIKKLNNNSFVFICTGVPFIRPRKSYFNNYAIDQSAIINMIKEFDLKNVVFLTGSAHYSEISQWPISETITITEFMCSPMGTIPRDIIDYEKSFPPNPYSVNGSVILNTNNFGQISISGKNNERKLSYNVYDENGTVVSSFELNQKM